MKPFSDKSSWLIPVLSIGGIWLIIIALNIFEPFLLEYLNNKMGDNGQMNAMANDWLIALLKITRIFLWMLLVIVAVRLVNEIIFGTAFRARRGTEAPHLVRNIFAISIYVLTFFIVFKSQYPGVDLAALFTTSAIFGVILGLALQDTLGNLFAGLSLQADQPFSVGDVVNIPNKGTGVVESITWRGVKIRTFQNKLVIMSHSILGKEAFEVAPRENLNARLVNFTTTYTESPANVIQIVREAVRQVENVSPKMRPLVRIRELGNHGIDWEIKYWLEDYSKYNDTDALVRQRVWYVCFREEIKFAYPTHTLHIERRPKEAEGYSNVNEIFERLSNVPIFAPLTDEETMCLVTSSAHRVFAPNEVIIRAGDKGSSMFVVHRGGVKIQVVENGKMQTLTTLDEGDIFGEMGLFTGAPRTATVTASEETEVLEISYPSMKQLFETNPSLIEALSHTIAERRIELDAHNEEKPPPKEEVKEGIFSGIKRFFGLG